MSLFAKLKDTKLKSLKFGQTNTLGDSSAPYIVADINDGQNPSNPTSVSRYDDGFIRGGSLSAAKLGITDLNRITKFLTKSPNGTSFIKKQVGLQLSNPQLETKQLPQIGGSGLFGQILNFGIKLVNGVNNAVGGPTRIYNLGANTLAQIPLNAVGGHIVRHGILPVVVEDQKYENVVRYNNENGNNRLVGYYSTLMTGDKNTDGQPIYSSTSQRIINSYSGGPNSSYGIGRTTIKRYDYSMSKKIVSDSLNNIKYKLNTTGNINKISLGLNKALYKFFGTNLSKLKPIQITSTPKTTFYETPLKKNDTLGAVNTSLTLDQNNTRNVLSALFGGTTNTSNSVYNKLKTKPSKITAPVTLTSYSNGLSVFKANSYERKNIDTLIKKLDPNYQYISRNLDNIYSREDSSIMSVAFRQIDPFTGLMIKSTENTIFSAYIKGYSEDHQSNWNDIKYNGRSDFFYNFVSYKKTASFNLQIPVFNHNELLLKHKLLENLKKTTAGAYFGNRLGGVITYIKLGYYLDNVPCIINNMKITIPDEAAWDWGIKDSNSNDPSKLQSYSTLLDVSFSITVIGDKTPGWNTLGDALSSPGKTDTSQFNTKLQEVIVKSDPFDIVDPISANKTIRQIDNINAGKSIFN